MYVGKGSSCIIPVHHYRKGEELQLCDGRPAGELLLATGTLIEGDNPEDCLMMRVALVRADRLYTSKKQILESLGYGVEEVCALYV